MARRRDGRKIDNVAWVGVSNEAVGLTSGSEPHPVLLNLGDSCPITILRFRGEISAALDGATVPGKRVHVAVGMQLVPSGTDTTLLRSPIADANSSAWFWLENFVLGYTEYVTDVIGSQGWPVFRKTIDGKAMRRMWPDQEVQVVFENLTASGGGASGVTIDVVGRLLLGF